MVLLHYEKQHHCTSAVVEQRGRKLCGVNKSVCFGKQRKRKQKTCRVTAPKYTTHDSDLTMEGGNRGGSGATLAVCLEIHWHRTSCIITTSSSSSLLDPSVSQPRDVSPGGACVDSHCVWIRRKSHVILPIITSLSFTPHPPFFFWFMKGRA